MWEWGRNVPDGGGRLVPHVSDNVPAVRMMVRGGPATAVVWVAVLLLAGLPAAAMALPGGMLGGTGFGESGGGARLAVEGGGLGGRIALAARRLAPTKPGCVVAASAGGVERIAETARVVMRVESWEVVVDSGVRVERLDLPPPGLR